MDLRPYSAIRVTMRDDEFEEPANLVSRIEEYKKYITSLTNNLKLEQLLDLRKQFKNPNLVRDLLDFIENVNLQRESSESLFVSRFAHHSSIENLNAK